MNFKENIPESIILRVKKLRETIEKHRYNYHVLDKITMPENALDSLKKELLDLEIKYPTLVTKNSPTQRVGGAPLADFKKVKHQVAQWSFNDAFDEKDIFDFDNRVKKNLKIYFNREIVPDYISELKIDGLKIVLTYEKGVLVLAVTRGNGEVGEDITSNIKTIESVPLVLSQSVDLIVEGEVFMGKKAFLNLNRQREKAGESLFANPRNAAAGSVRQLDPKIASSRKLDVFIYDIARISEKSLKTQKEELELLRELGFKVNKHFKFCRNINEVIIFWKKWQNEAKNEDYGIDGVVVKINDRSYQEALGYTGKAPRFGIAFKFPAEQTTTIVEDIIFQIGRSGVVTPVAKLKSVLVAGSMVSRATLHNEDEIKRLDIRIGDTVILQKAGDVIPDIVSVVKEMRTGKEKSFIFPKFIAECGGSGAIEKIPGQVAWRCKEKNSAILNLRRLEHFVGKKAFDIEGCGPKILKLLMDNNLVSNGADLFVLKKEDLLSLPRFAEKSADNLLSAIEDRRRISLNRLIVSLSIPQVGEETAEDLAERFKNLNALKLAGLEDLEKMSGVGPVVAKEVYNWFRNKFNENFFQKLLKEVKIENVSLKQSGKFEGKTFVLTGSLSKMTREEAKQKIKFFGGKISSAVSAKTDFLVAGENAGSKLEKAKKFGVSILNEEEFEKMSVV